MSDTNAYWNGALKKYGLQDWIDKPTIFVEQVARYLPKNGKVLELAAGQGQDSRYLATLGFIVVCTDSNDYGLEEAKRKARQEKLSLIFQKVDLAKHLPFADGEFEAVYSHLGLHYFDKKHTVSLFSDIRRILRPNGVFAALFNTFDDPEIEGPDFEKVEDYYYHEKPTGLFKRYFSVEATKELISGLFKPIILDQEGLAYKDGGKKLVRLIAHPIR